jgi:hypothetical protein
MKRVAPSSARSTPVAGELIGTISGIGLLIVSFLPWYSVAPEAGDFTAWQAFSVVDLFIAAAVVAALSVGICVLFRISVSYPVAGSAVTALFGAIALVLIAYRLVNPPKLGAWPGDVQFGAWLGLIAAAGVTLGGYLGLQEPRSRDAPSGA